MNKKESRGGKRESAGRKPSKVEIGRFAGRIEQSLLDSMKAKGHTSRSVLEWAIPLIKKKSVKAQDNQLEKLMFEYTKKIENCDTLIAAYTEEIRGLRNQGQSTESERKDRAIVQAQKQAYIQAKVDFESLLG